MYAQMIKSTGKGVKSLDEMDPQERAFQERIDAGGKIEPKDWMPEGYRNCLLYTSPSPRDRQKSRMPSSA